MLYGRDSLEFVRWVRSMNSKQYARHLRSTPQFAEAVEYAANKHGAGLMV